METTPARDRSVPSQVLKVILRTDCSLSYDREAFLQWISTYPSETVHDQTYEKKHPGTGDWLLHDFKFVQWMNASESAVLWCHGKR